MYELIQRAAEPTQGKVTNTLFVQLRAHTLPVLRDGETERPKGGFGVEPPGAMPLGAMNKDSVTGLAEQ